MNNYANRQSIEHKLSRKRQKPQRLDQDSAVYTPSELQRELAEHNPRAILHLQRTAGNAAVQRLLHTHGTIQRNSKVDTIEVQSNPTVAADPFVTGRDDNGLDIHPSDVKQGMLGDCFMVAALAEVAQQNPALIRNAINPKTRSPSNTYTVTFYRKKGSWNPFKSAEYEPVPITVTAEFPAGAYVDKKGHRYEGQALHAATIEQIEAEGHKLENSNEIWAALMEKAYGQFISGGYDVLNKGGNPDKVMEALSGRPSDKRDADDYTAQELQNIFNSGGAITLLTYGDSKKYVDSKTGLIAHHAYYASAVDAKAGTITVQNPHGYKTGGDVTLKISELDKHFTQIQSNDLNRGR